MTRYWKLDILRKLIKLEEESGEKATITMNYLTYLKRMLEFNKNEEDLK
ncbi:MAG: hypothetical protein KKB88_05905 [Nanoarchaeota archaeon]|nr:hypothetical protein [Nanoarchaeota archaeon]